MLLVVVAAVVDWWCVRSGSGSGTGTGNADDNYKDLDALESVAADDVQRR